MGSEQRNEEGRRSEDDTDQSNLPVVLDQESSPSQAHAVVAEEGILVGINDWHGQYVEKQQQSEADYVADRGRRMPALVAGPAKRDVTNLLCSQFLLIRVARYSPYDSAYR